VSVLISGNYCITIASDITDQASRNHTGTGQQAPTTQGLLDPRPIRPAVLSHLSTADTTGNGIPPHDLRATSLDADRHPSDPDGKETGSGKDRATSLRRTWFFCINHFTTARVNNNGDLVGKSTGVENFEGVLGAGSVVWQNGVAYLYH